MISEAALKWLPGRFEKLIRYGEFQGPGETITNEEYKARVEIAKQKIVDEGLDALIVFGDCYRMSNIRWLVNYRTIDGVYPQPMLMYLVPDRDPVFFLPSSEIPSAHGSSAMCVLGGDIREIRSEWAPFLKERAAKDKPKKIGISGYTFMDLEFWFPINDAFGDADVQRSTIIEQLKSVKNEAEIASMKRAARVSNAGIQMLMDLLRDSEGITELEATSLVYAAMFANGGHAIAYDIMIQAGEHTDVLFKRPTERPIRRGELVMMDYGIRVNDYASDNARTICYGNVSDEAKRLMEACSLGYEECLQKIYAGMTGIEADRVIREAFRKHGVDEYLVEVSEGRTGAHATGMDPEEDIPEIGPGCANVLEEGQTFAYELSLIVPGIGGVRTEDQVVVRKNGLEPLHTFNRFLYVD
ncbi:Xaa-Pro peptidase family protein [Metabacillus sp. FJAT-53654]|jgi:Xaa-Pro dipeptidase|uniref:Xaa-Pro peptidase family protein n=1 Tax=Metabacillus rhizosphaerae TaxID=3117747 RepID=A0ABZ2MT78_9BACI